MPKKKVSWRSFVTWPRAYGDHALPIVRMGFSPVSVMRGTKEPLFPKWQKACSGRRNITWVTERAAKEPCDSLGIACGVLRGPAGQSLGRLFAVDIDADDPVAASVIEQLAIAHLGPTAFIRTRPDSSRRILIYRHERAVKFKFFEGGQILGGDRFFVAFGRHPDGADYEWLDASPATIPATEVPPVTSAQIEAFRKAVGCKIDAPRQTCAPRPSFSKRPNMLKRVAAGCAGELEWVVRDGRVVDGREAFLTFCTYETAGDAELTWILFSDHAELGRPKGRNPRSWWDFHDAERKAARFRRNAKHRRDGTRSVGRPRAPHRGSITAEQQQAHTEIVARAHREGRIRHSALALSAAMLAYAEGSLGTCTAAVATLAEQIGKSDRCVQIVRNELVKAGLWSSSTDAKAGAFRPVFPTLSEDFYSRQPSDISCELLQRANETYSPKSQCRDTDPLPELLFQVPPTEERSMEALLQFPKSNSTPIPKHVAKSAAQRLRRPVQLDLFAAQVVDLGDVRRGGILLQETRVAIREAIHRLGITQDDAAREMRISRPQFTNVIQGRFGLGKAAARKLAEFIATSEAS